MSLQLILGSSGAGKSHHLYSHIIEESVRHPERNYIVVVPEQYTMAIQKRMVSMHPRKGILNIDVVSFERLAYEVFEEVGLHATNITYYGSQPWGFDSNLLLGYFADVEGDTDIILDEEELESAGFVKREDITYEPNLMSLTATMIEEFRLGNY